MAELKHLLDEIKKQGELTRGTDGRSGNNSLKGIFNSLLAIRTVGIDVKVVDGIQSVPVGGGSGGATPLDPVVDKKKDPELGLGGLLRAAIRNQTVGRVERGVDAAKEAAAKKFQESFIGQGIARGRETIGERKESFAESLRGLAGLQTNAEKREIEEKQLAEQKATRDEIEKLVEVQTAFLGLSQDEAEKLRNAELRKRDLEAGGATPTAAMMGGASGGAAAGGGGAGGAGGGVGSKIGGFIGGLGGGILGGFVKAIAAVAPAAPKFAIAAPLIGVGLAGFILAIGAAIAGAAWLAGKALPTLGEGLDSLADPVKKFQDIDGDKLAAASDGMADMLGGLASIGIGGLISGLTDISQLGELADVMKKFNDVDGERLKPIGPAMQSIGGGLAVLGGSGVIQGIAGLFGGDSPIQQFETLAIALKKFDGINADNLVKVGPAVKGLGEGLSAMGSGGLKDAVGGIVGAFGSLFGAEKEDPIENIKKFATLGEGETGTNLLNAGNALSGLGRGLNELNKIDTKGIAKLAENILPPLTKLGNAFSSEVFMFGDENPIASTLKAFEGLKELENINGKETKTKLISIGEGLEDFAKTLDDGEIETLAQYVREVAGPILALTGRGGGGGAGGGTGKVTEDAKTGEIQVEGVTGEVDPKTGKFVADISTPKMMAQDALMQGPSIAAVNKALYGNDDPRREHAMYAKVIENLKKQGYSDEMLSPENFERATGKKGGGSISIDGKTYDMRAIGLYQNLKEEQMAKSRAINAGSNDVASAQRKEGAPTVVAPTNNNQSTTVNNVNNSSGGGGGGISARRPRQIRGGMYDTTF